MAPPDFLTAGFDIARDRIEVEVVGWRRDWRGPIVIHTGLSDEIAQILSEERLTRSLSRRSR